MLTLRLFLITLFCAVALPFTATQTRKPPSRPPRQPAPAIAATDADAVEHNVVVNIWKTEVLREVPHIKSHDQFAGRLLWANGKNMKHIAGRK